MKPLQEFFGDQLLDGAAHGVARHLVLASEFWLGWKSSTAFSRFDLGAEGVGELLPFVAWRVRVNHPIKVDIAH